MNVSKSEYRAYSILVFFIFVIGTCENIPFMSGINPNILFEYDAPKARVKYSNENSQGLKSLISSGLEANSKIQSGLKKPLFGSDINGVMSSKWSNNIASDFNKNLQAFDGNVRSGVAQAFNVAGQFPGADQGINIVNRIKDSFGEQLDKSFPGASSLLATNLYNPKEFPKFAGFPSPVISNISINGEDIMKSAGRETNVSLPDFSDYKESLQNATNAFFSLGKRAINNGFSFDDLNINRNSDDGKPFTSKLAPEEYVKPLQSINPFGKAISDALSGNKFSAAKGIEFKAKNDFRSSPGEFQKYELSSKQKDYPRSVSLSPAERDRGIISKLKSDGDSADGKKILKFHPKKGVAAKDKGEETTHNALGFVPEKAERVPRQQDTEITYRLGDAVELTTPSAIDNMRVSRTGSTKENTSIEKPFTIKSLSSKFKKRLKHIRNKFRNKYGAVKTTDSKRDWKEQRDRTLKSIGESEARNSILVNTSSDRVKTNSLLNANFLNNVADNNISNSWKIPNVRQDNTHYGRGKMETFSEETPSFIKDLSSMMNNKYTTSATVKERLLFNGKNESVIGTSWDKNNFLGDRDPRQVSYFPNIINFTTTPSISRSKNYSGEIISCGLNETCKKSQNIPPKSNSKKNKSKSGVKLVYLKYVNGQLQPLEKISNNNRRNKNNTYRNNFSVISNIPSKVSNKKFMPGILNSTLLSDSAAESIVKMLSNGEQPTCSGECEKIVSAIINAAEGMSDPQKANNLIKSYYLEKVNNTNIDSNGRVRLNFQSKDNKKQKLTVYVEIQGSSEDRVSGQPNAENEFSKKTTDSRTDIYKGNGSDFTILRKNNYRNAKSNESNKYFVQRQNSSNILPSDFSGPININEKKDSQYSFDVEDDSVSNIDLNYTYPENMQYFLSPKSTRFTGRNFGRDNIDRSPFRTHGAEINNRQLPELDSDRRVKERYFPKTSHSRIINSISSKTPKHHRSPEFQLLTPTKDGNLKFTQLVTTSPNPINESRKISEIFDHIQHYHNYGKNKSTAASSGSSGEDEEFEYPKALTMKTTPEYSTTIGYKYDNTNSIYSAVTADGGESTTSFPQLWQKNSSLKPFAVKYTIDGSGRTPVVSKPIYSQSSLVSANNWKRPTNSDIYQRFPEYDSKSHESSSEEWSGNYSSAISEEEVKQKRNSDSERNGGEWLTSSPLLYVEKYKNYGKLKSPQQIKPIHNSEIGKKFNSKMYIYTKPDALNSFNLQTIWRSPSSIEKNNWIKPKEGNTERVSHGYISSTVINGQLGSNGNIGEAKGQRIVPRNGKTISGHYERLNLRQGIRQSKISPLLLFAQIYRVVNNKNLQQNQCNSSETKFCVNNQIIRRVIHADASSFELSESDELRNSDEHGLDLVEDGSFEQHWNVLGQNVCKKSVHQDEDTESDSSEPHLDESDRMTT